MEIPRHWEKSERARIEREGRTFDVACWGWSQTSIAEARRKAAERLAQIARNRSAPTALNLYPYGARPLKEKILREVLSAGGQQELVLTINSYGATVLNSSGVLFVDIDIPQPKGPGLLGSIKSLFGKKPAAPTTEEREAPHLLTLENFVRANGAWSFRVYRTAAGLRYIATHASFDPASEVVKSTLELLGCDPTYTLLCGRHKSFRARLTPKPWRIKMQQPGIDFPFADEHHERAFDQWQQEYSAASQNFATCKYLKVIGSRVIVAEAQEVLSIHDRTAKADSDLPLA